MSSQPLFILGAPRSGTTFLVHAVNQHPLIQLTSEHRIFVLLKDLVEERSKRPDLLEPEYQERFAVFVRRNAGQWVENFYRESLGVTAPVWGDKHPSYGDPAVLSGRDGGTMAAPASGSCLRLIRECLPNARFVHLHRHPWQVAASMKRRGWVPSRAAGVQVWQQYVEEIEGFLDELPEQQRVSLSFFELVKYPSRSATKICNLLGLGVAAPIARFLHAQRLRPTPFSSPTTDLSQPHRLEDLSDRGAAALRGVAHLIGRFGYAD